MSLPGEWTTRLAIVYCIMFVLIFYATFTEFLRCYLIPCYLAYLQYKLWPKFFKDKINGNEEFWQSIISNYTITYPNLTQLVRILFAVAPSTGPLERSYSKLAKICYKDRNRLTSEHIETLYLLSLLKDEKVDYDKATKIMENH